MVGRAGRGWGDDGVTPPASFARYRVLTSQRRRIRAGCSRLDGSRGRPRGEGSRLRCPRSGGDVAGADQNEIALFVVPGGPQLDEVVRQRGPGPPIASLNWPRTRVRASERVPKTTRELFDHHLGPARTTMSHTHDSLGAKGLSNTSPSPVPSAIIQIRPKNWLPCERTTPISRPTAV